MRSWLSSLTIFLVKKKKSFNFCSLNNDLKLVVHAFFDRFFINFKESETHEKLAIENEERAT
jgi:hypothetical protein